MQLTIDVLIVYFWSFSCSISSDLSQFSFLEMDLSNKVAVSQIEISPICCQVQNCSLPIISE